MTESAIRTDNPPGSVHAVRFSSDDATSSSAYLRYGSYGEQDGPLTYNVYVWAIRTPPGVVLFDTGFSPAGFAPTQNRPAPITNGLSALGIGPEDVQTIILSHLHYDQCNNLDLFPSARVVLQRKEWEFACSPMGGRGHCGQYFTEIYLANLRAIEAEGRMLLVDGDTAFAPGLDLITLFGHSMGSQGLVVRTADGACLVLAGDAGSFYDTWRKD